MSPGFAATRKHRLEPFAQALAEAGFVVTVHDHRSFGASTGSPRHDIDPFQQIEDWRRVIAHLATLPYVDRDRIGVWGSSYSGGHALVLGATASLVRAVFAQVPTTDGFSAAQRRIPAHILHGYESDLIEDEIDQAAGAEPRVQHVVAAAEGEPAVYRSGDAADFYLTGDIDESEWHNAVTVQSSRRSRHYVPADWVARISPKPLFMLIAKDDVITPTDLALQAYATAREPKAYKLVAGGHFDPYTVGRDAAVQAAVDFFTTSLR